MAQIQRNIGGYIGNRPSKTKIGSYIGNGPYKNNIGVFTPNQQFNLARRGVWKLHVPVLSFDGTDDYVDCGTLATLDVTSDFTIEFWATHPVAKKSVSVVVGTVDHSSFQVGFGSTGPGSEGKFGVIFSTSGFNWTAHIFKDVNEDNVFRHYAIVKTAGNIEGFEDGVSLGNFTFSGTIQVNSYYVKLAAHYSFNTAFFFEGKQSDTRIWNTARTQTEIQNNMNKRLTGNEAGLVAYYKLDEGTGTTATDSAGSNDGTINGATWVEPTDLELYE